MTDARPEPLRLDTSREASRRIDTLSQYPDRRGLALVGRQSSCNRHYAHLVDAALAALIGAGVGAVVPAAAGVLASHGDRRDKRDARMFDHRREAYLGFSVAARRLLEASWEYFHGPGGHSGDPEPDVLDGLIEKKALVDFYGTRRASESAATVIEELRTYIFKDDGAEQYRAVQEAIDRYTRSARTDLGARS